MIGGKPHPLGSGRMSRLPIDHLPFTIHHSLVEPLEALAKWGQLWYMRPKITTEKIGEHQLFFHPQNTQELVLAEYQKRLRKLKIMEAPLRSSS